MASNRGIFRDPREIADSCFFPDDGIARRAAIDGGVGADFDTVLNNDPANPQRLGTVSYTHLDVYKRQDYFLQTSNSPAPCTATPSCFTQTRNFAWNHGDFQKVITHTWLGLVGPGVRERGRTGEIFSDHTDIRPTIMSLARLKDDYTHDGRVLFEVLTREALPDSLRDNQDLLSRLAAAYKPVSYTHLDVYKRQHLGERVAVLANLFCQGIDGLFDHVAIIDFTGGETHEREQRLSLIHI